MSAWRYIAQRALTGELLHLELPLRRDELRWDLSGPGALRATVTPDTGTLRAADGRLLLEEWGTLIYAEADGEIRWGGIVVSSAFSGDEWKVEAAGFSTYPNGIPFTGEYHGAEVDPADIVRTIWAHLQEPANGDLGVTVSGATPVRLGTHSDEAAALAATKYTDAKRTYDLEAAKLADLRADLSAAKAAKADTTTITALTATVKEQETTTAEAKSVMDAASAASKAAADTARDDGGAYDLVWWDSPDCGGEIDNLAKQTPFDYTERHYWSGEEIRHEIQLGYPRLGRRRTDLAFVQGDNIGAPVTAERDGEGFANEVLGLGAGEGRSSVRSVTAVSDGRLRRTHVYAAKDVGSATRLSSIVRDQLQRHQQTLEIKSVEVVDHPNARIGSWVVGDDVLIEATIPWLGEISLWCRITAWTLTSETTATLSLARSDSFTYGG